MKETFGKHIMDAEYFVKQGYLQELNRQFLHPLGLALSYMIDSVTQKYELGYVIDCRDDPEGIIYDEMDINSAEMRKKAENVRKEYFRFSVTRKRKLGFVIQPIPKEIWKWEKEIICKNDKK